VEALPEQRQKRGLRRILPFFSSLLGARFISNCRRHTCGSKRLWMKGWCGWAWGN